MLAAGQRQAGHLSKQATTAGNCFHHQWQHKQLPFAHGSSRSQRITCEQRTIQQLLKAQLLPSRLRPIAVSYADPPPAQAGQSVPTAAVAAPANFPLAAAEPWQQAGQGLTWFADGSCSFKVWAPHAQAVTLQVRAAGCPFAADAPQHHLVEFLAY